MGKGAKTKGYLKDLKTGGIKKFIYNPNSFSTSRGAEYMEISSPGSSYPQFQYVRGEAKSVNLDLFLRSNNSWEVQSYVDFLNSLLPSEDSNSRFKKPNPVLFSFGSFVEKCIVLEVGVDYEDFDSSLNPTQAVAKLKLAVIK